jgi:hypothetical protein
MKEVQVMTKKRGSKEKKAQHTMDSLSKAVRDISAIRKKEVENDPELSQSLCKLADYAGSLFKTLLTETIKTPIDADKKKDMLLVLHLTYLKLCAEILDEDVLGSISDIPISGYKGTSPINTKKENVPLYV